MGNRWQRFDYVLLVATLVLIGWGAVLIYSATLPSPGQPPRSLSAESPVVRQMLHGVVGLVLMVLVSLVDYRFFEEVFFRTRASRASIVGASQGQRILASFLHPLYVLNVGLLMLVLVVGRVTGGSQRWLNLGAFELQPSELAKLFIIITLAKYLADQEEDIKTLPSVLISLAHVALPLALIYLQPDLGTALVIGGVWLGMVVLAGARLRHLTLLAIPAVLAAPVAWVYLLKDYQRERFLVFLNPWQDPLGAGYNLIQSLVSVGSGGLLGKGLAAGTQSQLHFLRIQHTDYIFSVLGEELGFVGGVIFLVVMGVVLFRALRIAAGASELFGQLIAVGVTLALFFQSFVNVGMNTGLLPVTGIPLPFVSYGGSSLITLLLAEGILQSIAMHAKRVGF